MKCLLNELAQWKELFTHNHLLLCHLKRNFKIVLCNCEMCFHPFYLGELFSWIFLNARLLERIFFKKYCKQFVLLKLFWDVNKINADFSLWHLAHKENKRIRGQCHNIIRASFWLAHAWNSTTLPVIFTYWKKFIAWRKIRLLNNNP